MALIKKIIGWYNNFWAHFSWWGTPKVPAGWEEKFSPDEDKVDHGLLEITFPAKTLVIYFIKNRLILALVRKHAIGHMYQLPACWARKRWCIMAEEFQHGGMDGTWKGKMRLLPAQIFLGWGRYCPKCKEQITILGGFK